MLNKLSVPIKCILILRKILQGVYNKNDSLLKEKKSVAAADFADTVLQYYGE